jgi:hypothetical protein
VTPADQLIVDLMACELAAKHQPMEAAFRPVTVFQLTAALQLALRHPNVPPDVRATVERFLKAVRVYFSDCPTVLDVVRRGDDPAEDR